MSLLDQVISSAEVAQGKLPASLQDTSAPPADTPNVLADVEPPAKPARKPRAKADPAKPRKPRAKKAPAVTPPREPSPPLDDLDDADFSDFANNGCEAPTRPDLGEDFEQILSEKKPRVIEADPEREAPVLRPVEGSRLEARRAALFARLDELEEDPNEEETQAIYCELASLENTRDPDADPFGGVAPREPEDCEDPAEREKVIASIGAVAAVGEFDLPRQWQKRSLSDLRALQLQLKQQRQSAVVRNIVRRGYFSATALVECVGPMLPVGERGLECQGLTACLEADQAVLDALDLVTDELSETYEEYMSPWTLLALATAGAAAKLHSTNRSIRLAARDVPADLEARLKGIKPPPPKAAQAPPAQAPQAPPPAQAAPAPAPVNKGGALEAFAKLGFH